MPLLTLKKPEEKKNTQKKVGFLEQFRLPAPNQTKSEKAKTYFEPKPGEVRIRDVVREAPGVVKKGLLTLKKTLLPSRRDDAERIQNERQQTIHPDELRKLIRKEESKTGVFAGVNDNKLFWDKEKKRLATAPKTQDEFLDTPRIDIGGAAGSIKKVGSELVEQGTRKLVTEAKPLLSKANQIINRAKGVVEGDPLATLKNVEARVGVKPAILKTETPKVVEVPKTEIPKVVSSEKPVLKGNTVVKDFTDKAEKHLGRPILLTAHEKKLVRGEIRPSAMGELSIQKDLRGTSEANRRLPEEATQSKTSQTPSSPHLPEDHKTNAYQTRKQGLLQPRGGAQSELHQQTSTVPTRTGILQKQNTDESLEDATNRMLRERTGQLPENSGGGRKGSSLSEIIEKSPTPVNKKIGFLDYLRTPDRVLQKIGLGNQAKSIRVQYDRYLEELPKNIEKITEWSKRVSPESNVKIFQALDGRSGVFLDKEEAQVANEISDWLRQWADRLGLPQQKRIANYITHIFDDQLIQKEFDEDLAKIISSKVPGSVYDPFLQQRLGSMGYIEDTWKALDAYVKRATRKVHMDPALEALEDASRSLEETQWNYVKQFADRVNMRPTNLDNLLDNTIKSTFGYRLGQRPVARISQAMRRGVYRGLLGLNVGSALRNLTQGMNTYAKLGEKYTVVGYSKLLSPANLKELEDVGVLRNNFVQDRVMNASKKFWERTDKVLFYLFETAEKINRGAAYFGAKSKAIAEGMNEAQAIEYAKKIVRDTQFQFGAIDTPVGLNSDLAKTFSQFQNFTVKQAEFLGEMATNRDIAGFTRYALGGLFMYYTIGRLFGMEKKDVIPKVRFDWPPTMKWFVESVKAGLDSPDDYGNQRTAGEKIKDVAEGFTPFIPAYAQGKKSLQGFLAANKGGSYTKSGNLQYEIPEGNTLRATVFGKYALPQAREYYDKKDEVSEYTKATKKVDEALTEQKNEFRPRYNEIRNLINEGREEEAKALVDALTEEEYSLYKKLKESDKRKATSEMAEKMYETVVKVQQLKAEGRIEEATAIVEGLTDEEYRGYKSAKGQLFPNQ